MHKKTHSIAQESQVELHDFAACFVREITDLEKFPKEPKLSRLNQCLSNITHKINEVKKQHELIEDQATYIKHLLANSGHQVSSLSIGKASTESSGFGHSVLAGNQESISILSILQKNNTTMKNNEGSTFDIGTQASGIFEKIRRKTHQLKMDVKRLQNERIEHIFAVKKERAGSAKILRSSHTSTPVKK